MGKGVQCLQGFCYYDNLAWAAVSCVTGQAFQTVCVRARFCVGERNRTRGWAHERREHIFVYACCVCGRPADVFLPDLCVCVCARARACACVFWWWGCQRSWEVRHQYVAAAPWPASFSCSSSPEQYTVLALLRRSRRFDSLTLSLSLSHTHTNKHIHQA